MSNITQCLTTFYGKFSNEVLRLEKLNAFNINKKILLGV